MCSRDLGIQNVRKLIEYSPSQSLVLRDCLFVFTVAAPIEELPSMSPLHNYSWLSRDVRKKLKLKILTFYLHQVKVIFKHISAGLSSAR